MGPYFPNQGSNLGSSSGSPNHWTARSSLRLFTKVNRHVKPSGQPNVKLLGKIQIMCLCMCVYHLISQFSYLLKLSFLIEKYVDT